MLATYYYRNVDMCDRHTGRAGESLSQRDNFISIAMQKIEKHQSPYGLFCMVHMCECMWKSPLNLYFLLLIAIATTEALKDREIETDYYY